MAIPSTSIQRNPLPTAAAPHAPSLAGRVRSAVSGFFSHPIVTGSCALAGAAGIAVSSTLLSHAITRYRECIDGYLECNNAFLECSEQYPHGDWSGVCSSQREECISEYVDCIDESPSLIRALQIPLAISSGVLGLIIQKWLTIKKPTLPEEEPLVDRAIELSSLADKMKRIVFYIQSHYFLEAQLGVGYLYTGLWFYELDFSLSGDPRILTCESTAVGLASTLFGMYTHIKVREIYRIYQTTPPDKLTPGYISQHKKGMCIKIPTALCMIALASTIWKSEPQEVAAWLLPPQIVVLSRLLGLISADWADRGQSSQTSPLKRRICTIITPILHWQTPLTIVGYSLFFTGFVDKQVPAMWIPGLILVGAAGGIHRRLFTLPSYNTQPSPPKPISSTLSKVAHFVWAHKKSLGLMGFVVISESFHLARCRYEGACPFQIGESETFRVSADSRGINISIISGLITYYTRQVLRHLGHTLSPKGQRRSKAVLSFLDKYQFDLVSFVPYSLFADLIWMKRLDLSYDNPPLFMTLLGATLAASKEQIYAADTSDVGQFSNPNIVAQKTSL